MQAATSEGLRAAPEMSQRMSIRPILNGNAMLGESLRQLWKHKTPLEAVEILSQEDVVVTNKRDKEAQLAKLQRLDNKVREAMLAALLLNEPSFKSCSSPGLDASESARWETLRPAVWDAGGAPPEALTPVEK
jgi:hypothetical protein